MKMHKLVNIMNSHLHVVVGNIVFSYVLLIFRKTSYINGKLFPPWLDIDLKERFAYPDYYR